MNAVGIPTHHMRREGYDGKPLSQHGRGEHGRLGHPDDGHIEQLARCHQARIAKGGDDDGVGFMAVIGDHL